MDDDDEVDIYAAPAIRTRAVLLTAPQTVTLAEIPLESFESGLHVQVKIRAIGLNADDLASYRTGNAPEPVLAREAVGQIVALGAQVPRACPNLSIGQRVILEPCVPCRICQECTKGFYNVCGMLRIASGNTPGYLRKLVNWPAEMLQPLPPNVPYDLALFAEPLSRVIYACSRADLKPTTSVVVVGSDVLALLTCAYAHFLGCFPVLMLGTNEANMDLAIRNRWASHKHLLVDPPPTLTSASDILAFRKATCQDLLNKFRKPLAYETCFDTTGSESGAQAAIYLCKRTGKVVMLAGSKAEGQVVPLQHAVSRQIDILTILRSANTFVPALSCLAAGTLGDLESLITHKIPFEEAAKGFRFMHAGIDNKSKNVIRVVIAGDTS